MTQGVLPHRPWFSSPKTPEAEKMLPRIALPLVLGTLLLSPLVQAKYEAHWIQPSKWHGADGKWSSMTILVGTGPAQGVDVLVSTVLAESLVVDVDGCPRKDENPVGST